MRHSRHQEQVGTFLTSYRTQSEEARAVQDDIIPNHLLGIHILYQALLPQLAQP